MKVKANDIKGMSDLERHFFLLLQAEKITGFLREYKFHPSRKFRIDFANPVEKIAVEIEGGVWMKKARHTSGTGFIADSEKYNEITKAGYRLLRYCTKEQMRNFKEDYKSLTDGLK